MTKRTIILALGSNFNPEENMIIAQQKLREIMPDIFFTKNITTAAIGIKTDNFINCMAVAHISKSIITLTKAFKYVENYCGRRKGESSKGIIRMDIDVMEYNGTKYHEKDWNRPYIITLIKDLNI
jgi:2-amino-4-hydroxy-6-hydroxymethyldihydropteridine diphosphokinase